MWRKLSSWVNSDAFIYIYFFFLDLYQSLFSRFKLEICQALCCKRRDGHMIGRKPCQAFRGKDLSLLKLEWNLHSCWSIHFYEGSGLQRLFAQNKKAPCSAKSLVQQQPVSGSVIFLLKGFQCHSRELFFKAVCHLYQCLCTHPQHTVKTPTLYPVHYPLTLPSTLHPHSPTLINSQPAAIWAKETGENVQNRRS